MAITFINTGDGDTLANTRTSVIITAPASMLSGDTMIAVIGQGQYAGVAFTAVTPPAGWVLIDTVESVRTRLDVFYKTHTGSEPGTYTFTIGAAQRLAGMAKAFRGTVDRVKVTDHGANPVVPPATVVLEGLFAVTGDMEVIVASAGSPINIVGAPTIPSLPAYSGTTFSTATRDSGTSAEAVSISHRAPTTGFQDPVGAYITSYTSGEPSLAAVRILLVEHQIDQPTITAPTDNLVADLTPGVDFAWTHNDDQAHAQAGWALKRRSFDGVDFGQEEWWADGAQTVTSKALLGFGGGDIQSASGPMRGASQHLLDRCQNGVLWAGYWDGTYNTQDCFRFAYSLDGGQTFIDSGTHFGFEAIDGADSNSAALSMFIDLDDYCHVFYKSANAYGKMFYRRGTPNEDRTGWDWSIATEIASSTSNINAINCPSLVVHREGTGWAVHLVWSFNSTNTVAQYRRIDIAADGTQTLQAAEVIETIANGNQCYPSIDFHHTGDGKTVQGGAPHLYMAWSIPANGQGIRFKKATYDTGTWTWGTRRDIDTTRWVSTQNPMDNWLTVFYDGTQVAIVGQVRINASQTNTDLVIWTRDEADTTTTPTVLFTQLLNNSADRLDYGAATYDTDGNIYLLGAGASEASGAEDLVLRKWTRSGASLGSKEVMDATVGIPYVSVPRGPRYRNQIAFLYQDFLDWDTSSTDNGRVTVGSQVVTAGDEWIPLKVINPGTAATEATDGWPVAGDTYQYAMLTTDSAGAESDYSDWRALNPYEWWNGTAWVPMVETWHANSAESITFIDGTFERRSRYEWSVATQDPYGQSGPYATPREFTVVGFERWGGMFI